MTVLHYDLDEIPLIGAVPCGAPEAMYEDLQYEKLDTLSQYIGVKRSDIQLTIAKGDSMTGIGFYSGDLLFVNLGIDDMATLNGEVVLARLNGDMTIKRLMIHPFGERHKIELHSENPRYPPMKICDDDTFDVLGLIIGHAEFRRF
jgi:DNA polymerase V